MSDISEWDSTAANNNAVAPNGWPEGQAPSTVNDCGREVMAAVRRWYEDQEWRDFGDTPTHTGSTTFTLSGDLTATYEVGRRIRATDSSTLYGVITNSSHAGGTTTITVALDSGSLSASLSAVSLGPEVSNHNLPRVINRQVSKSAAYTTTQADYASILEVTGTTTISLGDASTLKAGYYVTVKNAGTNYVTVDTDTVADEIDGIASIVLLPGDSIKCVVNTAEDGYQKLEYHTSANGVVLEVQTASNSATIEFDLSNKLGFDRYQVKMHRVKPQNDNVTIYLRTSTDGGTTFDNTTGDYNWAVVDYVGDGTNPSVFDTDNGSFAQLSVEVGNASAEHVQGTFEIYDPADTGTYTVWDFEHVAINSFGNVRAGRATGGRVAAADVDALQFYFTTGNIASGTFILVGQNT